MLPAVDKAFVLAARAAAAEDVPLFKTPKCDVDLLRRGRRRRRSGRVHSGRGESGARSHDMRCLPLRWTTTFPGRARIDAFKAAQLTEKSVHVEIVSSSSPPASGSALQTWTRYPDSVAGGIVRAEPSPTV